MGAIAASIRQGKLWGQHKLQEYEVSIVAGVGSEVLTRRTIFALSWRGAY